MNLVKVKSPKKLVVKNFLSILYRFKECILLNENIWSIKYSVLLAVCFFLLTLTSTAQAVEEHQVIVKTLGGPFTSSERIPKEIPASLRIPPGDKLPAVVIVHGSTGIDGRGALMAKALNASGIATLEIDMWSPRRVSTPANRPRTTLDTLPDVYGALIYLNSHPRIQTGNVGITGFSWGGVVSMLTAFGAMPRDVTASPELIFKAHAPFYPACDVWLPGGRAERLLSLANPTGAPVLLHNGTSDDYDTEPEVCTRLPALHPKMPLEVVMVPDATHAFDGEKEYPVFFDRSAQGGKGANIRIKPDQMQGDKARQRVVDFFKSKLGSL